VRRQLLPLSVDLFVMIRYGNMGACNAGRYLLFNRTSFNDCPNTICHTIRQLNTKNIIFKKKKLYQPTVPNIKNKINDFNSCIKITYYEIY